MKISSKIPNTPCYVVDESLLKKNLEVLSRVQKISGVRIILALKGFAMFSTFPLIKKYLEGVSASSLNEARLGREEFGKEVHVCAPAYREDEFGELLRYADHIVFNSVPQWNRFKEQLKKNPKVKAGLRINPEHSEVRVPLYDPCSPGSRLGITLKEFAMADLDGITGLHFHTLCELNSDSLERTLEVFENKFANVIGKMEWVNFGGGHHITRHDYDVDRLCGAIKKFREKYPVTVYLEPGEAIALNTGYLVSSVLDVMRNEIDIAILDTSAAAHMPDVLEMPYRPEIQGAGKPGEFEYTYRLGGMSCLAGDIIGDYSFKEPLKPGDRLVFLDMAHYTMVKNNTFNGVALPSIGIYYPEKNETRIVRKFDYSDFRNRLS
ncbi:MAG: carboxynorspermidine decarboxylase [Candidatus Omnitrophota bacterium]